MIQMLELADQDFKITIREEMLMKTEKKMGKPDKGMDHVS